MHSKIITLLTPYFRTTSCERQRELDECIAINVQNNFIGRIVLLIDDGAPIPIQSDKIRVLNTEGRPTYADWFDAIKMMGLHGPVVLANSDIYFDETLGLVHDVLHDPHTLMALSRWEVGKEEVVCHPKPHWSQDVWAIAANGIHLDEIKNRLVFPLGVPRCDNKVAYVFATNGWNVRNPCSFIKSYHLHQTQLRNYDKKKDMTITGTVAYVEPSETLTGNSALHFDTWLLKKHQIVKVSVNNSLDKSLFELEKTKPKRLVTNLSSRKPKSNATPGSRLDLYNNGKCLFANRRGLAVYEDNSYILVAPSFDPRKWLVLSKGLDRLEASAVTALFNPVINIHLNEISDRPKSFEDVNFWQYPCLTEKQAYLNHLSLPAPCINQQTRQICVYAPLPWATYIDNKHFPTHVLKCLGDYISFLRAIAEGIGFTLNVYTVCQHIRWWKTVEYLEALGITDLAASHCEADKTAELNATSDRIHVHPWSLYAVNYCDPDRSQSLVVGKPMCERAYLASFIGAHMPFYRSDTRVRLCEGLAALKRDDVIVDLGDDWHFNEVVYNYQVKTKHTKLQIPVDMENSTSRYNRILSESKFSLCPEGSGPNTLRFWESIAVGSIPVLFNRTMQFPKVFDEALSELCFFWTEPSYSENFYNWLKSFTDEELQRRSLALRKVYLKVEKMTCF